MEPAIYRAVGTTTLGLTIYQSWLGFVHFERWQASKTCQGSSSSTSKACRSRPLIHQNPKNSV